MPDERKPSTGPDVAPVPRVALRVAEAAVALGVSEDWFADHVAPDVACVRRGRVRLYTPQALTHWVETNAERLFDGVTR